MKRPPRLSQDPGAPESLKRALGAEAAAAAVVAPDLAALREAIVDQAAVVAGGVAGAAGAAGGAGSATGGGATAAGASAKAVTGAAVSETASTAVAVKVVAGSAVAALAAAGIGYAVVTADPSEAAPKTPAAVVQRPAPLPPAAPTAPVVVAKAPTATEMEFGADDLQGLLAGDGEPTAAHAASRSRRHPGHRESSARTVASHAVEPEAEPETGSGLAEQIELYDKGRRALKEGRVTSAIARFETYLDRYPDGELWQEASVFLLDALIHDKRHERVAVLAGALVKRQDLKQRHGEFYRVRAEALAKLGRCDEAERAFDQAIAVAPDEVSSATVRTALANCAVKDAGRR